MVAARSSPAPHSPVERRGALRHAVEVAGVLVGGDEEAQRVLLVDLSERGCQIIRPARLTGGAAVRLSFAGFAPFDATVIWTSTRTAGLRFDYPAHPALIARVAAACDVKDRMRPLLAPALVRREVRERLWHLHLPATLRLASEGAALPATLHDLSTKGCRVASAITVLPGTNVLVTVGGHGALAGTARWSADGEVGIAFADPLSPAAVEAIARSSG